jgi:hypothetical protein
MRKYKLLHHPDGLFVDLPVVVDDTLPRNVLILRGPEADVICNFETGEIVRSERPVFTELDPTDQVLTLSDFEAGSSSFKGEARFATSTHVSNIAVTLGEQPSWATHVVWWGK